MGKRKQQQSQRVIYLACEGTKTEYWYFKLLGELLDEDSGVQLKIYPDQSDLNEIQIRGDKGVKTDHKNLCSKVAEKLESDTGIDEGWIVIDKDGHLGIEATFQKANQAGVRIAFSSISFEHWLLLHFEKNDKAFEKSDCKNRDDKYVLCGSQNPKYPELDCHGDRCVASLLRLKNYLPDFDKSSNIIFNTTRFFLPTAYENAAWLRWRKQNDLEKNCNNIFQVNPFSNVDQLLKSIYQDDEEIIWGYYGGEIKIGDLRLIVKQLQDSFLIYIENTASGTKVILPTHFFLTDTKSKRLDLNFSVSPNKSNVIIEPGRFQQFYIFPGLPLYDPNYLNFKFGNHRVIFTQ